MGLIASGSFIPNYFASGVILSGNIASGQIGGSHIASGTVANVLAQTGGAIASRSLTDQTATNSGNIVVVSGTGLYSVNCYAEITQGGLANAGTLSTSVNWTSDSQAQSLNVITGVALLTSGSFGQGTGVIRVLSGTAIILTVTLGSITGTPHYNAYAAVQRVF